MATLRLAATILLAFVSAALISGCASYPDTPPTTGKQLVLTLKVRGRIAPSDPLDPSIRRYYFIAIDNDNNENTGPWAVVAPPWGGNGWVTSQYAADSIGLTSFVQYDQSSPGGYVYSILPGSYFLNTSAPQIPIKSELLDGGSTLRITLDFSQIATDAVPADQITRLDINFITTNILAVNPGAVYENRQWDALGPSGQDYVTIDTTGNRTYMDEDVDSMPVADADLDIESWSIEVQTVSSR